MYEIGDTVVVVAKTFDEGKVGTVVALSRYSEVEFINHKHYAMQSVTYEVKFGGLVEYKCLYTANDLELYDASSCILEWLNEL